ncbi:toll/interleukin-1 receptor domain-containing protein [Amycolatopsis sp. cmx-8-4]|uniref:toll/interleukin-1 receptor domain-containing protein n=1 Tax=Amycolatopsis sp. cmx-8-4 TaxID=2790947 RepID=UPI00397AC6D8
MTEPGIELFLVSDARRGVEDAARQVDLGKVRLGVWQVHPVRPTPGDFVGLDIFLVKVNYELVLEPDVPEPEWMEVGFRFDAGDGREAAVLDAVPLSTTEARDRESFVLDTTMSLVHADGGAGMALQLPPVRPVVEVFGLGSSELRWRHRSDDGGRVGAGSRVAWLVLAVGAGTESVAVSAKARYDLPPEDTFGDLPASRPRPFRLQLATAAPAAEPATTVRPATVPARPRSAAPRVFISYTRDTPEHAEEVRRFAGFLVRNGIDADLDRWNLEPRRDWYLWAAERIRAADFILVVASPLCRRIGDGEVEDGEHPLEQSELALLRTLLLGGGVRWATRVVPVVLLDGGARDFPLFLGPGTGDHYRVSAFDVPGAEELLRLLTDQPAYLRPPQPGEVVRLPPRD